MDRDNEHLEAVTRLDKIDFMVGCWIVEHMPRALRSWAYDMSHDYHKKGVLIDPEKLIKEYSEYKESKSN